MTTLITGGAGFIGINFVKYLITHQSTDILTIDKMSYVSNETELLKMKIDYKVIDIADKIRLEQMFSKQKFDMIIHFAAESHVDNSIKNSRPFVDSNVLGTVNLLDLAVKYQIPKFIHISTDEVFEEVPLTEKFNEQTPINPRNPYSASKAAAEHFVMAYGNTHKLPYIIVNSSNNYGPWQYPEKLIPLTTTRILKNQSVPVYGQGLQIRDWIYVEDTCKAIFKIAHMGKLNSRYCIGGDNEITNIDLVKTIITKLNADPNLITFTEDRPGHDFRYATDITKIRQELNWQPMVNIDQGLDLTLEWIKQFEHRG